MEHCSIPRTHTSPCCKGRQQLGGGGRQAKVLLQAVPLLLCGLCRRTAAIPGELHRASASYPSLCKYVHMLGKQKGEKGEKKRVDYQFVTSVMIYHCRV